MDDSVQKMLDSLKTDKQWDFKIVSGTANLPLSEEICGRAGVPLTPLLVKKFADGELFVQVSQPASQAVRHTAYRAPSTTRAVCTRAPSLFLLPSRALSLSLSLSVCLSVCVCVCVCVSVCV
eukprot:COSAG01_NODE_6089_length_3856_cov_5.825219_1_plen_122_part_00